MTSSETEVDDKDRVDETGDTRKVTSTEVTAPVKPVETVQEKARKLLKYGQLPMFAPARRDWSKGELLCIDEGPEAFSWPPLNWQSMDADKRLLSVEFAANLIEFCLSKKFPTLSRSNLLDKYMYNFLVLPGTSRIRRSEQERYMQRVASTLIKS
ncbi:MAG: hypothetical protein AB2693_11620 [Candidatus Thiodiazotropha sp.]